MYSLYVIELRKTVFSENRKFREANPQYNGVLECVYVGMTSKSPQERFKQHKEGALSKKGVNIAAAIVQKYGIFLRPSLYAHLPKYKNLQDALDAEQRLASSLRSERFAVWVN
jgi:predicted GIY-YIG superfamily endonuclease